MVRLVVDGSEGQGQGHSSPLDSTKSRLLGRKSFTLIFMFNTHLTLSRQKCHPATSHDDCQDGRTGEKSGIIGRYGTRTILP